MLQQQVQRGRLDVLGCPRPSPAPAGEPLTYSISSGPVSVSSEWKLGTRPTAGHTELPAVSMLLKPLHTVPVRNLTLLLSLEPAVCGAKASKCSCPQHPLPACSLGGEVL